MYPTGHMKRKVEYLLRSCSCQGCATQLELAQKARVVSVVRCENHQLWREYEQRRDQLPANIRTGERSRPINCELADDECMLFHGTGAAAAADVTQYQEAKIR